MAAPLVLVNAVGLTPRLLQYAPRLQALAAAGWQRRLREVLPAVTCTAQASMLTGTQPDQHGIVANGWLFRETGEVRFWQQSNRLLQAEPIYVTAAKQAQSQGKAFRCAKVFWWFNQGADVTWSVTPKPHYGADGNKAFGIHGQPAELCPRLESELGPFPFHTFWGPFAGLPCTRWLGRAAASVLQHEQPDLTLVYLPHLDYEPQRVGTTACDLPKLTRELDEACAPLLDQAKQQGARVWVVSEYGHCTVDKPVFLNRVLRTHGWLEVRPGPFGEMLDTFTSRAFAVCDHQLAHIYVRDKQDIPAVQALLSAVPGVARHYAGEARQEIHLDHPRSGEIVLLAEPAAWFAYPYWLDDRLAPDFARTVDIHRKPGYDPCELLLDPKLWLPKLRLMRRLVQKKLGLRTLFDVTPLDAHLIRGSHGLHSADPLDQPVFVGDGPLPAADEVPLPAVRDYVLQALGYDR